MTTEIAITLAIAGAVLVVLALTSIPTELVLLGAMVLLTVLGTLTPGEALAGFANPGVMTIAALYVVVAGLVETGTMSWLSQLILRRPKGITSAQTRLLTTVGFLSSFINNTPVVAMFIPVAQQWATRYGLPISKLLLPMNNIAILGGLCTLLGTSTNLAVNGLLMQARPESALQLFDLAWVGVPLTLAGIIYALIASRWLLPNRSAPIEQLENAREYSVQVRVNPNGPLVGRTIAEVGLRNLQSAYVLEIERQAHLITVVGPHEILQADDILTCVGVVDAVKDLRRIPGLAVLTEQTYRLDLKNWQRQLVELVLSQTSQLVGQTVREAGFRTQYNAAIVSISREGQRLPGKLGDVVLKGGDTFLVEAGPGFVEKHKYSRDFLLVSPVQDSTPPDFRRAPIAVAILVTMITVDVLGLVSLFEATFVAAGLMIATGCVSTRNATRSIEYSVVVAIAASYALGIALSQSGAAKLLAQHVFYFSANDPMLALIIVYVATVIFTEVITNNAAGVLMFPVALAVADNAGVSHLPFVIAVMVSASAGFITPVGYQTNLMVYGAGGYHFGDFVRFGLPLSALVALIALTIIPSVWAF
jgi:di/tricarboxylate transporter